MSASMGVEGEPAMVGVRREDGKGGKTVIPRLGIVKGGKTVIPRSEARPDVNPFGAVSVLEYGKHTWKSHSNARWRRRLPV